MRVYLWKHYADREPSYADYHCRTDDKHHHLGSEFGFVSAERGHSIRKWDLCLDTPSTIPPAGAQSESVTFTPSNTTDYTTVTSSTTVEVNGLSFSNPTINTGKGIQIINGGGPALVPFPNGLNAKAVLQLLYVDPDQDVEMAYSTDGLNYTNVGRLTVPYGTGVAELDCTPVYTDHCGVAAAEYNSKYYMLPITIIHATVCTFFKVRRSLTLQHLHGPLLTQNQRTNWCRRLRCW